MFIYVLLFKAAHQETGAKHMNVQNSLNELPSQNLSYPIPKSSVFCRTTGAREAGLLALMYICLNNPQNTRKQNGNYGISISRSRTALLQLKKVRKDAPLFTWSRAEPAGTFHIYYLKTLLMRVKTGTGIRELHTPRQVSCYSVSQSNNEGNRGAPIELSLGGLFHLLYPTIAHLQCNVKFFFHGCQKPPAPDADVLTKLLESWTVNEKRDFGKQDLARPPAAVLV